MTKRLKLTLVLLAGGMLAVCLLLGCALLTRSTKAQANEDVTHAEVAVHDPSIVLAYEGADGKTYSTREGAGSGARKAYYVFGTQLAFAKSYDLVNWTNFETNLHNHDTLYSILRAEADYSGNDTAEKLFGNCWAPDVIWNSTLNKWCMYLSVNGDNQYSVIVLLTADTLTGPWERAGGVVWSRITASNIASTDYTKVTGKTEVDPKYAVYRNSSANLLYGVNAIDAAVTYDDEGKLWLTYGSWFGGIYLLELDPATGLRNYEHTYENEVDYTGGNPDLGIANGNTFMAISDEYLGIHLAGGHHSSGEGPYIEKIGDYYFLFLSYGGYDPASGYNMRLYRSDTITGPYLDATGADARYSVYTNNVEGSAGNRLMTGYSWSWWDFAYIAEGHNSAFVDEDGRAYLVYHNKFTDGSVFHVMKVHQLLVNEEGWLVAAPFETTPSDEYATGLEVSDIVGEWGYLFMTRNNGKYASPLRDAKTTVTASDTSNGKLTFSMGEMTGNFSGNKTGTLTYDPATAQATLRISSTNYKGYLLRQNIEGTDIATISFAGVNTDGTTISKYIYWAYRYPSEEAANDYFVSKGYAIPSALSSDPQLPTYHTDLWDGADVTYAYENGKFTVSVNGTVHGEHNVSATQNIAEYEEVSTQRFLPARSERGISVSFDYENYKSDWDEVLTGEKFRINLSVLEMLTTGEEGEEWGSIFESAASGSGNYTSFYGNGRATIRFNADGTIDFLKGGTPVLHYAAETSFTEALCREVIAEFAAGTVRASYPLKNVVIAEGDPAAVPAAKTDTFDLEDGSLVITWKEAETAENTNTNWWIGAFGAKTLPAGNQGLQYVYTREHNFTDNAIQMQNTETEDWGTFYPFGPLSEFGDGWQTSGEVNFYLNGVKNNSLSLTTGNKEPSEAGFWNGRFVISVFRYEGDLYVVCDFTRATGSYHLVAVYHFANITAPLLVQLGGFAADMTGTVAEASSLVFHEPSVEPPEEDDTAVTAFVAAVEGLAQKTGMEEKLAAIRDAFTKYAALTAEQKARVTAEYGSLLEQVANYNAAAEKVNASYDSALGAAFGAVTAAASVAALAAVWFVLKKAL